MRDYIQSSCFTYTDAPCQGLRMPHVGPHTDLSTVEECGDWNLLSVTELLRMKLAAWCVRTGLNPTGICALPINLFQYCILG